ncbi:hypothetical protein PVAP13_3KG567700 [Panicum virgatum]|uniref:Uncharacterized protein n=1 Tax=Panicum virgatum TaxID=38727 RepID=A0A8T0VCF8_PANVG|nr:hypothetical protein PVAP13_3KG567700 [Panicum virgatum]
MQASRRRWAERSNTPMGGPFPMGSFLFAASAQGPWTPTSPHRQPHSIVIRLLGLVAAAASRRKKRQRLNLHIKTVSRCMSPQQRKEGTSAARAVHPAAAEACQDEFI